MKRGRASAFRGEVCAAVDEVQCPICLCEVSLTDVDYPFDCGHALCCACDGRLRVRGDHRCPTCRKPRLGMDQDVAEELNLARYHASVARPAHATTMFFPMSNPTENAADVIHQSLADPTGEHNGARITLGERLPSDVVGALINLPESGSLEDWRQAADRDGAARHLERMRTRSRARDAHVERRAQRLRAQLRETSTVSEESFY